MIPINVRRLDAEVWAEAMSFKRIIETLAAVLFQLALRCPNIANYCAPTPLRGLSHQAPCCSAERGRS